MLTRLHIRGFKNLLDVDVKFGPFTCVAGPNGAGKSNLFDGIRLLNLLTRHSIMEAAQMLREAKGRSPEPGSLFTAFQNFRETELSIAAEMIVERAVQDEFGVDANAAITTLSYEVAFRIDSSTKPERLELAREVLRPISLANAKRGITFPASPKFKSSCIKGKRNDPFISTNADGEITVHQEGHGGRKLPAPKSSRTVVGGMATADFPSVLAAHREMASWQTLMLEPSAMRAASSYQDPKFIDPRGANLPAAIQRLARTETRPGQVYASLANRLAELIQDIESLLIRDDSKTETLTLEVRDKDGIALPARSLSDGTLRFLVLATLALDPRTNGLICLEEPENGIHPERIPAIVKLLKDIAVDTGYPVGQENPLRQVLVNTHSPEVIQNILPDDLILIEDQYITRGDSKGRVAALRIPDNTWRSKSGNGSLRLPPGRIKAYFGKAAPPETRQLWLDFMKSVNSE